MAAQHGEIEADPTIPPIDVDGLADELRQLLGLRSRATVRDRHLPVLWSLLDPEDHAPRDRRYAALTALVDDGIARIEDPAHRRAAEALLGSGDGRWRTVAQRGGEAASAFGCGWDAYRRRRSSGPSQLDNTIEVLALALLEETGRAALDPGCGDAADVTGTGPEPGPGPGGDREPDAPPAPVAIRLGGSTAWDDDLVAADRHGPAADSVARLVGHPGPARRPSRRGVAAAVAIAILVVGAAGLVVVRRGDTEDRTGTTSTAPSTDCATMDQQPGDLTAAAAPELEAWSAPFEELAASLPDAYTACAGFIEDQYGFIAQPVSAGGDDGVGALLAGAEPGRAVYLHHGEWARVRAVTSQFGPGLFGVPVRRADRPEGPWVVEFTDGVLVTETSETPTFWIAGALWEEWTRLGGLDGEPGAPVSFVRDDPNTGRVVELEHGRLVVDYVQPQRIRWEPEPNPAADLPPDHRGKVLTASGGRLSWLVDQEGVRHWIPTEADYICATAAARATALDEIPPAAIATLEVGPMWRCR